MDITLNFAQMPYVHFPRLAKLYAELEQGHGQEFVKAASELGAPDGPMDISSIWHPRAQDMSMDAHRAILCADTHHSDETFEQTKEATRKLNHVSVWAGSHFNGNRVACAGWKSVPSGHFSIG